MISERNFSLRFVCKYHFCCHCVCYMSSFPGHSVERSGWSQPALEKEGWYVRPGLPLAEA